MRFQCQQVNRKRTDKTHLDFESFAHNGGQHVGRVGNPNLRLYRVFAGAEEDFDVQMLLDPAKSSSIPQRRL